MEGKKYMMSFRLMSSIAVSIALFSISSCKEKGCTDPNAANYKPSAEYDNGSCEYEALTDELKIAFRENYANMVYAAYADAYAEAVDLQTIINVFVNNPTIPGLSACREQWILAHIPYSQTEVCLMAQGPLDNGDINYADRINAWDMEPAFLDYVNDSSGNGIIYDTLGYATIDQELLVKLNMRDNRRYVTLGFHAIEFMLWGEDQPDALSLKAGNRSYSDFVPETGDMILPERRANLLKAATDQLVLDLKAVRDAWAENINGNYRKSYMKFSPRTSTRLALTGVVGFGKFELALNRIESAFNTADFNQEESRFSDNTHRDIYYNTVGIRNIMEGKYARTDSTIIEGTSLMEVLSEFDEEEALYIQELLDLLLEQAKEITAPYDYNLSLELQTRVGPISDYQATLIKIGNRLTELATDMDMGIKKDLPQE